MVSWSVELSEYNTHFVPRGSIKYHMLAGFFARFQVTCGRGGLLSMVTISRWCLDSKGEWRQNSARGPIQPPLREIIENGVQS